MVAIKKHVARHVAWFSFILIHTFQKHVFKQHVWRPVTHTQLASPQENQLYRLKGLDVVLEFNTVSKIIRGLLQRVHVQSKFILKQKLNDFQHRAASTVSDNNQTHQNVDFSIFHKQCQDFEAQNHCAAPKIIRILSGGNHLKSSCNF